MVTPLCYSASLATTPMYERTSRATIRPFNLTWSDRFTEQLFWVCVYMYVCAEGETTTARTSVYKKSY